MNRYVIFGIIVWLSFLSAHAAEVIDSVSYSLGYNLTLSMFAGNNPLIENDEEFDDYIKGLEENLTVEHYQMDDSYKISYNLGAMQGIFFSDGLQGKTDDNVPPINCIVEGLRDVGLSKIELPQDTLNAAKIIKSADGDPMKLDADSRCAFFKAYGIMKAMKPDIQSYMEEFVPDKSLTVDRKAYAMGMADYLNNAFNMPESAYELGEMITASTYLKTLPFKLDKPSFIKGAKDVWGFGEPLISRQRMSEILNEYRSSEKESQNE